MHQPIPLIATLSACLLLGGFSAGAPPLSAGMTSPELARSLAEETHHRLDAEFVEQSVGFALDGAAAWSQEDGLLRVRAEGTADFGVEGTAATTVDAVYDPHTGKWLELEYQLL